MLKLFHIGGAKYGTKPQSTLEIPKIGLCLSILTLPA